MSGQAQPATCGECRTILIPPDPAKRQLISRKTVKLCDFHAQAEALLKALRRIDVIEWDDGWWLHIDVADNTGRQATFHLSGDQALIEILTSWRNYARAAIEAARPQAAAKGGGG